MTPRQKAIEMYNDFLITTPLPINVEIGSIRSITWDENWIHTTSKKHALICVEQIFKFMKMDDQDGDDNTTETVHWLQYWIDVRNEIEIM